MPSSLRISLSTFSRFKLTESVFDRGKLRADCDVLPIDTHVKQTKPNTRMCARYAMVSDSGGLRAGWGVSCDTYIRHATTVNI